MPESACNAACRRAYAGALRAFLTGRCTNDEYDDRRRSIAAAHGHDDACEDIHAVVWATYSDLREHRLDRALRRSDGLRRFGARAILFLHTDEPYESDFEPSVGSLLRPLVSLPLLAACIVGLWIASPLVLACLIAAWMILAIATIFGPGVEWRPGLFAHVDQPGGRDHWPFADRTALDAAAVRPFWLAG